MVYIYITGSQILAKNIICINASYNIEKNTILVPKYIVNTISVKNDRGIFSS